MKGDACGFNHIIDEPHKPPCAYFLQSQCRYGEECMFSHTMLPGSITPNESFHGALQEQNNVGCSAQSEIGATDTHRTTTKDRMIYPVNRLKALRLENYKSDLFNDKQISGVPVKEEPVLQSQFSCRRDNECSGSMSSLSGNEFEHTQQPGQATKPQKEQGFQEKAATEKAGGIEPALASPQPVVPVPLPAPAAAPLPVQPPQPNQGPAPPTQQIPQGMVPQPQLYGVATMPAQPAMNAPQGQPVFVGAPASQAQMMQFPQGMSMQAPTTQMVPQQPAFVQAITPQGQYVWVVAPQQQPQVQQYAVAQGWPQMQPAVQTGQQLAPGQPVQPGIQQGYVAASPIPGMPYLSTPQAQQTWQGSPAQVLSYVQPQQQGQQQQAYCLNPAPTAYAVPPQVGQPLQAWPQAQFVPGAMPPQLQQMQQPWMPAPIPFAVGAVPPNASMPQGNPQGLQPMPAQINTIQLPPNPSHVQPTVFSPLPQQNGGQLPAGPPHLQHAASAGPQQPKPMFQVNSPNVPQPSKPMFQVDAPTQSSKPRFQVDSSDDEEEYTPPTQGLIPGGKEVHPSKLVGHLRDEDDDDDDDEQPPTPHGPVVKKSILKPLGPAKLPTRPFQRDLRPRPTPKGFHGDTFVDENEEEELFNHEHLSAGINFDKYFEIPVSIEGENVPEEMVEFDEDIVPPALMENVYLCKFTRPTPVQQYAIPCGLLNRDLLACAQTGSGKTAGFLFPVIISLLRSGAPEPVSNSISRRRTVFPYGLILAPTRELGIQIYEEARRFCYRTGIRPVVVYGGQEQRIQTDELKGGADLLIATPGRLNDFVTQGKISLELIQFLILDEADRMLDMGFEQDIRKIVERSGMPRERKTFMFSATFPKAIQKLAKSFMKRDYIFVQIGRVGAAATDVKQTFLYVEEFSKTLQLQKLLASNMDKKVLVFVKTKRQATTIEITFEKRGFKIVSIHGDKTQPQREEALEEFKSGRKMFMVATDVAARGLDIPRIDLVVNFDLPQNVDDYVHRIGRTGRAGNVGAALSFFNDDTNNMIGADLVKLLSQNGQEVPDFLQQTYGSNGRRATSSGNPFFLPAQHHVNTNSSGQRVYGKHFESGPRNTYDDDDDFYGEGEDFYKSMDQPSNDGPDPWAVDSSSKSSNW